MGEEVSMIFHEDTGLLELQCSGSSVFLTHLEAALVYTMLKKSFGLRGRYLIWKMRRKIKCTENVFDT